MSDLGLTPRFCAPFPMFDPAHMLALAPVAEEAGFTSVAVPESSRRRVPGAKSTAMVRESKPPSLRLESITRAAPLRSKAKFSFSKSRSR